MKSAIFGIILSAIAIYQTGCKKANDWLNVPRSKADVTFNNLKDYQSLLNNTAIFNVTWPTIGLIGTDNLYVVESNIQNLPVIERNSYLWNKDIYEGRVSVEYSFGYQAINYANTVLQGIEKIDINPSNSEEYNFIKGQAHFFRAFFYFELASLYCKPFVEVTAAQDKGLCLRTKPDINEVVKRSSVFDTYKLILNDAHLAANLLPLESSLKTRPSKKAVYLLLSRVYLNMGDYETAKSYADSTLQWSEPLINFNTIPNSSLPFRFPDFRGENSEILFYAQGNLYQTIYPSENTNVGLVDTLLYRLYELNDLRRTYFYREFDSVKIKFKGGYTGAAFNFCGLGINEAYLIRAECNARLGDLIEARKDLNFLLKYRYRSGTFVEFASDNPELVLRKILLERRKELPFTGNVRWQDLRRLNLDPRLATPIFRRINGELKELKPNDSRYVYPIPQSEINLTGIEQNPR